MKNLSHITLLVVVVMIFSGFGNHKHEPTSEAASDKSGPIVVQPNEVVLETKGIVCSFCSFGAKKNLSKLDFIDTTQGKDKAISTDIHSGQITIKLNPLESIELGDMAKAVKQAGYKFVAAHLNLKGSVTFKDNRYILAIPENGQTFVLEGEGFGESPKLSVQSHIDAEKVEKAKEGLYTLTVDRVIS